MFIIEAKNLIEIDRARAEIKVRFAYLFASWFGNRPVCLWSNVPLGREPRN